MTLQPYHNFWQKHPALYYGLAILFGTSFALDFHWILFVPTFATAFTNKLPKILPFSTLILISFFYIHLNYQFPNVGDGITGKAHIEISSVKIKKTFYGKQWFYKGRIKSFDTIAKNIDFSISLPFDDSITRPPANRDYELVGTLKQNKQGNYFLKVQKNTPWIPIPYTFSFAELRYRMKTVVVEYIKRHYPSERAANFLSGIAAGDFDDRTMSQEFAQFGLQHIMAISGFHFAIIASILGGILKFVLPKQYKIFVMIGLLSMYFFFLGCSPSIMRAWIAIALALVGMWMGRESSGLNSLGFALIFVLIVDPLLCLHMGFQFSFITTAAILLIFGVLDQFLKRFFYYRSLSITFVMTPRDQHAYCAITTLRQAAALALAVNLIALPMTLFFFQNFPYLSLVYNLFFPFLISFSMLLLLIGFFIPGVEWLNTHYTNFVLNFTHQMPQKINFVLESSFIPLESLILYLTLVFAAAIFFQHYLVNERKEFVYL